MPQGLGGYPKRSSLYFFSLFMISMNNIMIKLDILAFLKNISVSNYNFSQRRRAYKQQINCPVTGVVDLLLYLVMFVVVFTSRTKDGHSTNLGEAMSGTESTTWRVKARTSATV